MLEVLLSKIVDIFTEKGYEKAKEMFNSFAFKRKINELNEKYSHTELNSDRFKKFITDNNCVSEIINQITKINMVSDNEFISNLSNQAFNFVNKERKKEGLPHLTDKMIFVDYFTELMNLVYDLKLQQLKFEDKMTINTILKAINDNVERIKMDLPNIIMGKMANIFDNKLNELYLKLEEGNNANILQSFISNNLALNIDTKIILDSIEKNIKGEFKVKYDELIANFSSIEEMLNYLNFTQKPIELEPIELRIMIEDKTIYKWKANEKYSGKTITFKFTSYGEVAIISRKLGNNFDHTSDKFKLILYPQEIDQYLKINLENEDFETLLQNIILKVEKREIINDNNFLITISNKDQKDSYINIKFIFEIKNGIIEKTTINTSPYKENDALYILKWLNFMKNMAKSKRLYARAVKDNSILFEAYVQDQHNIREIQNSINLVKDILFIERKLNIKFDFPKEFKEDDINDIYILKKIIEMGKIKFNVSSFKLELDINPNQIKEDDEFLIYFTTNDKFRIFNKEIDLGEQINILPKVKIKYSEDNKLVFYPLESFHNLRIYKKYYGDYSIEKILEKEIN